MRDANASWSVLCPSWGPWSKSCPEGVIAWCRISTVMNNFLSWWFLCETNCLVISPENRIIESTIPSFNVTFFRLIFIRGGELKNSFTCTRACFRFNRISFIWILNQRNVNQRYHVNGEEFRYLMSPLLFSIVNLEWIISRPVSLLTQITGTLLGFGARDPLPVFCMGRRHNVSGINPHWTCVFSVWTGIQVETSCLSYADSFPGTTAIYLSPGNHQY